MSINVNSGFDPEIYKNHVSTTTGANGSSNTNSSNSASGSFVQNDNAVSFGLMQPGHRIDPAQTQSSTSVAVQGTGINSQMRFGTATELAPGLAYSEGLTSQGARAETANLQASVNNEWSNFRFDQGNFDKFKDSHGDISGYYSDGKGGYLTQYKEGGFKEYKNGSWSTVEGAREEALKSHLGIRESTNSAGSEAQVNKAGLSFDPDPSATAEILKEQLAHDGLGDKKNDPEIRKTLSDMTSFDGAVKQLGAFLGQDQSADGKTLTAQNIQNNTLKNLAENLDSKTLRNLFQVNSPTGSEEHKSVVSTIRDAAMKAFDTELSNSESKPLDVYSGMAHSVINEAVHNGTMQKPDFTVQGVQVMIDSLKTPITGASALEHYDSLKSQTERLFEKIGENGPSMDTYRQMEREFRAMSSNSEINPAQRNAAREDLRNYRSFLDMSNEDFQHYRTAFLQAKNSDTHNGKNENSRDLYHYALSRGEVRTWD